MIFKIIKDKNKNALRAISIDRTRFLREDKSDLWWELADAVFIPEPWNRPPIFTVADLVLPSALKEPTINKEPPKVVQIENKRLGTDKVKSTLPLTLGMMSWGPSRPRPTPTYSAHSPGPRRTRPTSKISRR